VTVYGQAKLLRAAAVLEANFVGGGLTIPGDIPRLVADGYSPDLPSPSGWEKVWDEAERHESERQESARHRAQEFAIAPPEDTASMDTWLTGPANDPEDPRRLGRAQVRDGGDSIEVIVVQRDEDGVLRLPRKAGPLGGEPVPEGSTPLDHPRLEKALAATTLSLPTYMCVEGVVEETIRALERSINYDTWQSSYWLAGQLALVLDASGRADVGPFTCLYADDLGLVVTKRKDGE
jgi:hypothetical protein